jgi:hypothetical protein
MIIFACALILPFRLAAKFLPHAPGTTLEFSGGTSCYFDRELSSLNGGLSKASSAQFYGLDIVGQDVHYSEGGYDIVFTGTLSSAKHLTLPGSAYLEGHAGVTLDGITVISSSNRIGGAVEITNNLTLQNSSAQVGLDLHGALNAPLILNGGSVTLHQNLVLGKQGIISTAGTINTQGYALNLPPVESTWTSTLYLNSNAHVSLAHDTNVSGMWIFGPNHSTSSISGNGHVLDLTTGGTIWVRSGHGLALNDVTIKGLAGESGGWILLEDENSTVSLSNVRLVLDNNFVVTQGGFYLSGADSTVVTKQHLFTFESNGTLTVDGVTCFYDPYTATARGNIRPETADGLNYVSSNGGGVALASSYHDRGTLVFDDASEVLRHDLELSTSRPLVLQGQNSSSITLDGQGHVLHCPATTDVVIDIAANKDVTLKNLLIQGLRSSQIRVGSGGSLTFGDGVFVRLADACSLAENWSISGAVGIDGAGHALTIPSNAEIIVYDNSVCTLCNMTLRGLENRDGIRTSLRTLGAGSRIVLADLTSNFDSNFTFSLGNIDIERDVIFSGSWQTFAYTSTSPLTIQSDSSLLFQNGMTFSYDSAAAAKDKLVFSDRSSVLEFCGASLHTTWTGIRLAGGRVVLDDKVTFSSEARNEAEALELASDVQVRMRAGSVWELHGIMTYE